MIRDERSNCSTFAHTTSQPIGAGTTFRPFSAVFSKHPVSNGREAGREERGRKTVEREITSRGRTLGGNARTKKSARARDEGPPPRCGIMLNKPT